jgi:hypothetical protein
MQGIWGSCVWVGMAAICVIKAGAEQGRKSLLVVYNDNVAIRVRLTTRLFTKSGNPRRLSWNGFVERVESH